MSGPGVETFPGSTLPPSTGIERGGRGAGIIGTSPRGRAFVPISVKNIDSFLLSFGTIRGDSFGQIAARNWLQNQEGCTFIRLLGVGDGKERLLTDTVRKDGENMPAGSVKNSGFIVGSRMTGSVNGMLGSNEYAVDGGLPGRTYFLGAFMSESAGSTYLSSAGIQKDAASATATITPISTTPGDYAGGKFSITDAKTGTTKTYFFCSGDNGGTLTGVPATGDDAGTVGGTSGEVCIQLSTFPISSAAVSSRIVIAINSSLGNNAGVPLSNINAQTSPFIVELTQIYKGPVGNTPITRDVVTSDSIYTFSSFSGGVGGSAPIIRGVLFAASGVLPALSGCYTGNASTASAPILGSPGTGATVGSFAAGQDGGSSLGAVNLYQDKYRFKLLLNGHIATDEYPNEILASFNPLEARTVGEIDDNGAPVVTDQNIYFPNVLNRDPKKIQQAGHYLYTFYDVYDSEAEINPLGNILPGTDKTISPDGSTTLISEAAFLITGSMVRNAKDSDGDLAKPNFENFCDRFQTAKTPWITSQTVDGRREKLFRIHAINDGKIGNHEIKVLIGGLKKADSVDQYGSFGLVVQSFESNMSMGESEQAISSTEVFTDLSLDPTSDNYIAKRIGDKHFYWDFDKPVSKQRFVEAGVYGNNSYYIRVEVSDLVDKGTALPRLLPAGFKGPPHLITSGSSIMSAPSHPLVSVGSTPRGGVIDSVANPWSHRLVEPPIPYREQLGDNPTYADTSGELFITDYSAWGHKITKKKSLKEPNNTDIIREGMYSYNKYFPNFSTQRQAFSVFDNSGVADSDGTVYDCDRFNNNEFSLEKILIHTASKTDDTVDNTQWMYAKYRRDTSHTSLIHGSDLLPRTGVRFFDFAKDLSKNQADNGYLNFVVPFFGGFDGSDLFSRENERFTNLSAYFEMNDLAKDEDEDSTLTAYTKALKMLSEKSDSDISVLAMPGIRIEKLTNKALAMAEERFDCFYLMDPEHFDSLGFPVTGSSQEPDLTQTADKFRSRALGSSFGAAYFPDLKMYVSKEDAPLDLTEQVFEMDETENMNDGRTVLVDSPASLHAIGLLAYCDKNYFLLPPAGTSRGALSSITSAIEPTVIFDDTQQSSTDKLYTSGLNPIISNTSTGPVVFGQRTLLNDVESIMQRINVRRMLIDIRYLVREVARNDVLFEDPSEKTLGNFEDLCEPILQRFLNSNGISRYKIQIDTSTTTQADIEANIVRGKIFLQPIRSEEIIEVDFVT